jgi:hypothetical protein
MPKGYEGAQKTGQNSGRNGFVQKPRGQRYFSLRDQQEAIVRPLVQAQDIEWVNQWKTQAKPNFPYGEKLNKIDQFEDGTPDPGYSHNLKSTWSCFIPLIWRNAPQFQKAPDGSLIKDANNNRVPAGFADCVAIWETNYKVYEQLKELEGAYQGIMSRDWRIKRIGSDKNTTYMFMPSEPMAPPSQLTPNDIALAQRERPDIAPLVRIPTYDELNAYLSGGVLPYTPDDQNQGQQQPPLPGQPVQQQNFGQAQFGQPQTQPNPASGAGGVSNPFLS